MKNVLFNQYTKGILKFIAKKIKSMLRLLILVFFNLIISILVVNVLLVLKLITIFILIA